MEDENSQSQTDDSEHHSNKRVKFHSNPLIGIDQGEESDVYKKSLSSFYQQEISKLNTRKKELLRQVSEIDERISLLQQHEEENMERLDAKNDEDEESTPYRHLPHDIQTQIMEYFSFPFYRWYYRFTNAGPKDDLRNDEISFLVQLFFGRYANGDIRLVFPSICLQDYFSNFIDHEGQPSLKHLNRIVLHALPRATLRLNLLQQNLDPSTFAAVLEKLELLQSLQGMHCNQSVPISQHVARLSELQVTMDYFTRDKSGSVLEFMTKLHPNIERLMVHNANMTYEQFEYVLKKYKHLKRFCVEGVDYQDRTTIDLEQHNELRILDLKNVSNSMFTPFELTMNSCLTSLSLDQVKLDESGTRALLSSRSLRRLVIRGFGSLDTRGLQELSSNQSLSTLDVKDGSFWSAGLSFIANMTSLRHIRGDAEMSDTITHVLNANNPISHTLQSMFFENLPLSEDCVERIVNSQSNLTRLRCDREASTEGLKLLSSSKVLPQLRHLDLRCGPSINDDGAFYLLLSTKLETLKMTYCTAVTDDSISLLRVNWNLKVFSNDFNDCMRNWTMASVVQYNTSLTDLSVCSDKVHFSAEDLQMNTSLVQLKFYGDKADTYQILLSCPNLQHIEAPLYRLTTGGQTPSNISPYSPPYSTSSVSESPSYRSTSPGNNYF